MMSIKIYEVRYCRYGADSEWHSGDCYSTAGIFTQETDAKSMEQQIKSIKSEYSGKQKYNTYIREIEINRITDSILREEMEIYDKNIKEEHKS